MRGGARLLALAGVLAMAAAAGAAGTAAEEPEVSVKTKAVRSTKAAAGKTAAADAGAAAGERAADEAASSGVATSLLPSPASPLVALRVQFRAGSIDDPAGREGQNALTAMMVGQGGTGDLSYKDVVDRLYPMAASIEVLPDREVTTFVGEVHRDHLKAFYDLFTALLLKPRFDPADLARHRDLLVAGIETNLRGADDETLGKDTLQSLMYRGHPYGRLDIGTVQGLKAITLDDVRAHYKKMYTRGRVVVGAAGGYPDGMIASIREDFGTLPPGEAGRAALPPPRTIEGMEVVIVEKPTPATAISIGFPLALTRAGGDFYALMVANSAFGEHRTFNGRLQNRMRAARGLNYGNYSYIENFLQDGGSTFPLPNTPRRQQHFSIWIRPVAPHNAGFALRQAVRELRLLVEQGLTAEEFEATRKYLLNYSRLWTQSLSRRLGTRMDSEFYGTDFFIDRIQKELPRLRLEDVNGAVKRHLRHTGLAVAIVTGDAAGLRDLLLSGKPTPIVYQTPTTSEELLKEDREIEAFPLPLDPDRVRIVPAREMFEK
jgi:zinc protease